MCRVCVTEQGSVIGIDGGRFKITSQSNEDNFIPKELVDGIAIYGRSHLSACAIQYCLERGII